MSQAKIDPLERIIRDANEAWLIDAFSPPQGALAHLRERLAAADAVARSRLGQDAPSLTPEALAQAYEDSPLNVRAFLQVLGSISSPEILLMVWRILHGMEVATLEVAYVAGESFRLQVRLVSSPETLESYCSDDIDDIVVLRHLGTMKMNGRPVFDGFYPLNVGT